MKLSAALLVTLSLLSANVFAATVAAVKGQKTLINLEGADAAPGDEFFLLDAASGKKKAVIRIKQVKNGRAIGEVLKGRANAGYTLQAKGTSRPMSAEVTEPTSRSERASSAGGYLLNPKDSYGVYGEYLMNTMDATHTVGGTVKATANMKDTSFGVGGYYDYAYTNELMARGAVAIEQFAAKGSSNVAGDCGGTDCKAEITYLSFYGIGKYNFNIGKYRPWVGAGGGFMIAVSKSSNILKESEITTNQVITLIGGLDIQMSRKNYIPVSLEYSMFFPPADLVKAHMIILKGGWAWNL